MLVIGAVPTVSDVIMNATVVRLIQIVVIVVLVAQDSTLSILIVDPVN